MEHENNENLNQKIGMGMRAALNKTNRSIIII